MPLVSFSSCLAMLAVVVICAGCGSSGHQGVSAGSYVSTVCSAITPLERDVVSRSSALNNSTAANAAEAQAALEGFLEAVAEDADRALAKIKAAGTPDVSNGSAVAREVVRAFTQVRDAMRAAVVKARSLPTNSPTAFKSGALALGADVRNALNNIDASGLSNHELEQAAAKEPACKSLTS